MLVSQLDPKEKKAAEWYLFIGFSMCCRVCENKCIFGYGNGMGGVRLSAIMKELGSLKMV